MGFFKSLLNVINPLPSIINANKVSGQSFGDKLLNVFNPAQSLIKTNTGQTSLQLSDEYKALTGGGAVLTDEQIQAAIDSGVLPADLAGNVKTETDTGNMYLIGGAVLFGVFLLFRK